jgi:predicted RecA/RadA family phage recombinase
MKNYVQDGNILTVAAPAAVSSGDGVLVGAIFGVAQTDADSGDDVPVAVIGVFDLPKTSALAISVGDPVYWDTGEKAVNKTAASNYLVGYATSAAANPSATVSVRLSGIPVVVTPT